jgi:hypothetical protein
MYDIWCISKAYTPYARYRSTHPTLAYEFFFAVRVYLPC